MDGMATYAARLASFGIAHSVKKRGSDAKGSMHLRWPHESPNGEELATAGFYFRPTVASPDNVKCFLCDRDMDGWEEDDNAVIEHLKHSPECGWAINMGIEHQAGDKLDNPLSEELLNARKMTFGFNWPHENKRGWVCKTQKMIESGWYYCPTPESDDFVKCSYCDLGLDGWEPKDNPYEEHLRRSPDCPFLKFSSLKPKFGRGRKSRASKTSRISMVSIVSAVSEGISVVDLDATESETLRLPPAEVEQQAKTGKGTKKSGKTKKPPAKPKKKAGTSKTEEMTITDSFVEPEVEKSTDKAEKIQLKSGRSKKRSSDEMSEENDDSRSENARPEDVHSQPPPAKRQATRTRSSVIKSNDEAPRILQDAPEVDTNIADATSMHPPAAPVSKKGPKRGTKRASATTRKASGTRKAPVSVRNASAASRATSTASVASLRSRVPEDDDDDIDAAVEAEFNRPLTDDEMEIENPDIVYRKVVKIQMRRSEIEQLETQKPKIQKTEIEVQQADIQHTEVQQPEIQTPSRRHSSRTKPGTKDASIPRVPRTPRKSPTTEGRTSSGDSDKENDISESQADANPWTPIEFEKLFPGSPAAETNDPFSTIGTIIATVKDRLPSPEKKMSIEEWVQHKAKQAEERLRNECERLVGRFEGEGMRALRTLESIACVN